MIRAFLRRLKRFLLRHSGMTAVTEAQAIAQLRLMNLASSVGEVKAELAGIRAAVGAVADPIQGLAAEVALGSASQEQLRASLERVTAALAEKAADRGREEERWQELAGQVRVLLGEQTASLRLLADQAATFQHRLLEEQGLNRLAIDDRLAGMYSQLVHIDSFYKILAELRSAYAQLMDTAVGSGLDKWKIQEYEGLLRYLRKTLYDAAVREERLEVPVVETDHPAAVDTDDSRFPWGAKNDNSICLKFNTRLYQLFPEKQRLAILDLGCAGGGFVRSLIDDGHLAVGLEGCELPKKNRLGEWGTIRHHLHTCDITRPFTIKDRRTGHQLRFDVITAWEVMEHIRDEDLEAVFGNIANHLADGGLFLCSVSTIEDGNPELGAVYHQTIRPRDWWVARLGGLGFEVHEQQAIGKDDWLRGSGNCRLDRHAEDEGIGFHLALRRREAVASAAA